MDEGVDGGFNAVELAFLSVAAGDEGTADAALAGAGEGAAAAAATLLGCAGACTEAVVP